jgi:putative transposase
MAAARFACDHRHMARLPRFFAPDTPLHVVQRGNNRCDMFVEPEDRSFFCECLAHAATRHGVAIHAYVLMRNHVHLLVTPACPTSVPRMMQAVGRNYVLWFNTRNVRTGALWEGRYKAAIVESERYLLACMRYIELNPVRAGLVGSPAQFPWSSFRANALGAVDRLVVPHAAYLALGAASESRRATYRNFFADVIPAAELEIIRDATQHAWAIGGSSFQRWINAVSRRPSRLTLGRPQR